MIWMDVIQAVLSQLQIWVVGTIVRPNSVLLLTDLSPHDFLHSVRREYRIVEPRFKMVRKVICL